MAMNGILEATSKILERQCMKRAYAFLSSVFRFRGCEHGRYPRIQAWIMRAMIKRPLHVAARDTHENSTSQTGIAMMRKEEFDPSGRPLCTVY
jgi:hypothetical protein